MRTKEDTGLIKWPLIIGLVVLSAAALLSGCSGSGFVTVGGSGALYNPNNEYAPLIVQQQPTQAITVGRARLLPMIGGDND